MDELTLQRVPFNTDADNKLRYIKSKTGLSANIICRLGFCLSLEEPGAAQKLPADFKHGREINRYTLLGKHDELYIGLLKMKLTKDRIALKSLDLDFIAHVHRGIELLSARIKTISDIGHL
jgi:DNA sulfur modification protein DndE